MSAITPSKRPLEVSEQSARPFKQTKRPDDIRLWQRIRPYLPHSYAQQYINGFQLIWNQATYRPTQSLNSGKWNWSIDTSPKYHLSLSSWNFIITTYLQYLNPLSKLNIDIPDHFLALLPVRQDTKHLFAAAFQQKMEREEGALSFLKMLSFEQRSLITEYSDDEKNPLSEICPLLPQLKTMKLRDSLDRHSIRYLPRSLESLSIGGDPSLSPDDWRALFRRCARLRTLYLAVSDDMDEITPYLPTSLREIRLNAVKLTDDSFAALRERCPHLKELGLYCIDTLTEEAFTRPFPNLKSLILEQNVDGVHENVILKCTPNLKSFTLFGRWDKEGSLAIPASIESLDLSVSTLLDETLSPILDRCMRLRELDLSYTSGWTGASFANRSLPLEKLSLAYVALSSEILLAILAACPRLKRLSLTGCRSLSDDLFRSLPLSLEWIELTDSNVSLHQQGILALSDRLRNLKTISCEWSSHSDLSLEESGCWTPKSSPA